MQVLSGPTVAANRFTTLILAIVCLLSGALLPAAAEEVVLRMRGGTFEVKGELKSYDTKRWVVTAPGLGTLSLEAARMSA